MEQVTITVSDETGEALTRVANEEGDGDRDVAAERLLTEWLAWRR